VAFRSFPLEVRIDRDLYALGQDLAAMIVRKKSGRWCVIGIVDIVVEQSRSRLAVGHAEELDTARAADELNDTIKELGF